MPRYRRTKFPGGTFFFTVTLADRSSDFARPPHRSTAERLSHCPTTSSFETVAICILPDHLHAIWSLPIDDHDYSTRWNLRSTIAHFQSRSRIKFFQKGVHRRGIAVIGSWLNADDSILRAEPSAVMAGFMPGIHVLPFRCHLETFVVTLETRRGWHLNSGLPEFSHLIEPQVG